MIKVIFNILSKNIFAASIAVNMFSTTTLLIALAFLGYTELAADVAIIQGATHAVFMAFSANARNLILGAKADKLLSQQFFFRFYMLLPLSVVAYLLSSSVVGVSGLVIIVLIFRRCSEWIAELQVTDLEKVDNKKDAHRFFYLQFSSLILLLGLFALGSNYYYKLFLVFWAVSPILLLAPFMTKIYSLKEECFSLKIREFLPHIGSSWVIAISLYVFRVIIVLLVGRSIGGILFSAYAIGGMLNSIYTYALGPSLIYNRKTSSVSSKLTVIIVSILTLLGVSICILSFANVFDSGNTNFFIKSIGFSMIGGGIMILAQQRRIYMLQVLKSSVFVPDVISNILMISILPLVYTIFGGESLSIIFLANSLLTYVFFSLVGSGSSYDVWRDKILVFGIENRKIIQLIVILLVFLPVFFQLNYGIFDSAQMFFESSGVLTQLPLPLASLGCFIGIMLLIDFQDSRLSVALIFTFFIAMLSTTFLLNAVEESNVVLGKLILLIQFILPTFALILGQSYKEPTEAWLRFESIFLYILMFIVPIQITATLVQQTEILTPYLYIFSIYQHLQYIPVVFVGGYLLALFTLFNNKAMSNIILLLAPLMIFYTVLSTSVLAIALLMIGFLFGLKLYWKECKVRFIILATVIAVVSLFYVFDLQFKKGELLSIKSNIINITSSEGFQKSIDPIKVFPEELELRKQFWMWHIDGITKDPLALIAGHKNRPDRSDVPSAYNYYLDLIYNFGLIALMPLVFLIALTVVQFKKCYLLGNISYKTVSLAAVVLYFVIIDNSFKVSFRQPFPGIFIFFIWGVLLNRLSSAPIIKSKENT